MNAAAASSFHCEQCNLTLTGYQQYQQHLAGKKHLNKIKQAGVVNTKINHPVGSPIAGYAGKFVTSASDKKTLPAPAEEGQFSKDMETAKNSPMEGGLFDLVSDNGVNKAGTQNSTLLQNDVQGGGNADPVMTAVRNNLLGKLPLKRTAYDGKCTVCNIKYSSKSHELQHLGGKKHAKKTTMANGTHAMSSATFFCGFCNLQTNSSEQMDQHREGTSHKKKVQNCKELQNEPQPPPAKKKFVQTSTDPTPDLGPNGIPPPPAELIALKPLSYDK